MIVLAIPFGLHIDVAGVVVTLGLLALIGLVVAPLSYAAALILKSEDAFAPLVQGIVMPLLLLSGILLPMALAPDWLQFLSNAQPADPRRRRRPGAVQQRLGQPGDPRSGSLITGALAVVRGLDRVPHVQPRQRLIVRSSLFTTTPAPWGTPASFRLVRRAGSPVPAWLAGARDRAQRNVWRASPGL